MQCPRCGFEQPTAVECSACGVIVAKWQSRKAPVVVAAPVPSRPTVDRGRASPAAVRDACLGLSRLLHAGVPIVDALRMLAPSARGGLAAALRSVADRVTAGSGLADAMGAWPGVFRRGDIALLRAAERVGDVAPALETISQGLDASIAVRRQLLAGSAYPLLILVSSILLGPIPSALLGGGSYLRAVLVPFAWLGGVGAALYFGVPVVLETQVGAAIRRSAWSLPWPATIYVAHVRALFCRGFSRAVASGLGLAESLQLAGDVTCDPAAGDGVAVVASSLRAGQSLVSSIGTAGLVSSDDLVLVAAAERSGTVDTTFATLADRYTEALSRGIRKLVVVVNVVLTAAVFIFAASGIVKSYSGFTGGTEDLMKQIDKESPMIEMP